MKVKLSLVAAVIVSLSATVAASAKPPAPAAGAACKPTVSFVLKGTFAGAAADGFTMNVTGANKHGRQFKGQQGVAVSVDAKTKFRRNGAAQLSDLVAGDRLLVQVRACKGAFAPQAPQQPAADGSAPAPAAAPMLLAKRVVAHPAQAASDSSDDSGSGSPSTTP
jgi:hypothetical protein